MNDDDDYIYLKVIATMVGFALLPPTVVAVAMSFIAPGKAWLAVIAVLTGWFIGWRLGFAGLLPTTWKAAFLFAGLWVIAAFATAPLIGAAGACLAVTAASVIAFWTIDRLEEWKEARDDAATFAKYKRAADARRNRDA